jgi:tetratricopeptide (TPR) repeat protein
MRRYRNMIIGSVVVILLVSIAGWVYIEQSNLQRVSEQAKQSLDSGISLFEQEKYPEALNVLESIPSGTSSGWWARYYQGSAHIMLKDYPVAVTYLEQAFALNPTEPRIMHALGVAYFKAGNFKLAKAYYAAVLEIDPDDEEAKGLIDIMVKFEKRQSGKTKSELDEDSVAEIIE